MKTNDKRMTSAVEGDIVVFLIGMRVNRWWKPWQWMRTGLAMARMLRELRAHPELGFLGAEGYFGRTALMVQYWKSLDHLLGYARMRDAQHLPAWRTFNRLVGMNGDVGIWHESYLARAGDHESVYVNMPAFGLGRAAGLREALGQHASAAGRLSAHAGAASLAHPTNGS
jgi:hypothetical protein